MQFSLFFFAAEAAHSETALYQLLVDGSQFAEDAGLTAVWTPERHFHEFGGMYPNPALTAMIVAASSSRVGVRAGSVVAPLHHPIRIAEEWSVVDNFSEGRVGISFASGWHAVDFALAPTQYAERKAIMVDTIETVRALWRGDEIPVIDGAGSAASVRLFPRPVQQELPVWVTSSGNPETFALAGELGANLLTHLLGQDIASLAHKIGIYRHARRRAAAGAGHVTLMIHTFLGDDVATAREVVREPFSAYLRTSFDLVVRSAEHLAASFDPDEVSEDEVDFLVAQAFDRYFTNSGLFGTPVSVHPLVERLAAIGVDEIACLIDFGVDHDSVREGLERLAELQWSTASHER